MPGISTAAAQFVMQMHNMEMFDLEKVSDGSQHQQWCHSMANIKIYNRRYTFFVLAFTISEILAFIFCTLKV